MKNACKAAIGLVTRFRVAPEGNADPARVRLLIPVIGLLTGLALTVAADLLLWLAHRGTGTLLGAPAVFALWWWLCGGRSTRGAALLVESAFAGSDEDSGAVYFRVSLFQAFLLIRLVCIGVLLYLGRSSWLMLVTTLSAAALADFAIRAENSGETADPAPAGHWLPAAVIALVVAGFSRAFVPGLFALVVAWLLPATVERWLERLPVPEEAAAYGGVALTECLLLLLGVSFFLA